MVARISGAASAAPPSTFSCPLPFKAAARLAMAWRSASIAMIRCWRAIRDWTVSSSCSFCFWLFHKWVVLPVVCSIRRS
ncbi:hypothetical protein ACFSTD_09770 [Novosphingobium colocasiae]